MDIFFAEAGDIWECTLRTVLTIYESNYEFLKMQKQYIF